MKTCPLLCLLAFSGAASAQTMTIVVREGDNIPGVGNITRIDNLTINNDGSWLVEVDTDNADTNADSVLIRDGAMYLREGQALPQPPGALLDSFDAIVLNDAGESVWNFFLDGTSGSTDDSGIYRGTNLLIQEGDASTAPELTPGTPFRGFFETKLNDTGSALAVCTVDDAAISSTVDQVLLRMTFDGGGALVSQSAYRKEGDTLPGQAETVSTFGTGPHNFAFNDSGNAIFFADQTGDTALDGVIYFNDGLLAQEGSPSPVPGRNWSSLSSPEDRAQQQQRVRLQRQPRR